MNFKKAARVITSLLLVVGMGLSYTSCSDDDDPKPEAKLLTFTITNAGQTKDVVVEGVVNGTAVTVAVPYVSDVAALTFEATVSNNAVLTPASGTTLDFSEPRNFVVANGELEETYMVTVAKADPDAAVLKSIQVASANTKEEYQTELDLIAQTITVTYNTLQADTIVVTEMDFGPNGAIASTEVGKGFNLALEDQKVSITYAGETKDYAFVTNVTEAGFNPANTENLLDKSSASGLVPSEISTNNSRGADFNGEYVFVASREGGNNILYYDVDATVFEAKMLDMEGVEGGSWVISDLKCVGDAIYASNMVMAAAEKTFKVYRWANVDAKAEVVLEWNTTNAEQRLGDALSIVGDPATDGYIFASNFPGYGGKANASEIYGWKATGGVFGDVMTWNPTLETANKLGQYGRVTEIPGTADKFMVAGAEAMFIINNDGTVDHEISGDVIQGRAMDVEFFEYNGGRYMSYTVNREWQAEGVFYEVVNITEGADALAGIKALTAENIEEKTIVAKKMVSGPQDAWVNANNAVAFNSENEPQVFAFSVISGFIIDTLKR
ncbi:MAG: DUF4623 domain-containing protein [Bacteroidales bacterium]|nr:DUF4623 domain-containing protein [Bacteroidales bacterium]